MSRATPSKPRARRWRRVDSCVADTFMTGDKFRGAVVWPWRGDLFRLQCWTYPRDRLTTFTRSRPLDEAKATADRWLSTHTPKPRGKRAQPAHRAERRVKRRAS